MNFSRPLRQRALLAATTMLLLSPGVALSQNTTEKWAWQPLAPNRRLGSTIYDPVRHRMILFGGTQPGPAQNDLWELSLTGPPVWRQLTPIGEPPPRSGGHTAIYDPIRDQMIVFGGSHDTTVCDPFGCVVSDVPNDGVWGLSLTDPPQWTRLVAPGVAPPEVWRRDHSAIYDPIGDRMIVYGGTRGSGALDDLWSLPLGTLQWTRLDPPAPTPGPTITS